MFLKRNEIPNISITSLYVGAIITIFSRQFKITDYGDVFTKNKFDYQKGKTFAMIKPDSYANIGKIMEIIEKNFRISKMKMVKFNREIAEEFYGEHKGKPFYEELINFICSDLVLGLEIVGDDAI